MRIDRYRTAVLHRRLVNNRSHELCQSRRAFGGIVLAARFPDHSDRIAKNLGDCLAENDQAAVKLRARRHCAETRPRHRTRRLCPRTLRENRTKATTRKLCTLASFYRQSEFRVHAENVHARSHIRWITVDRLSTLPPVAT